MFLFSDSVQNYEMVHIVCIHVTHTHIYLYIHTYIHIAHIYIHTYLHTYTYKKQLHMSHIQDIQPMLFDVGKKPSIGTAYAGNKLIVTDF